jgi:ribosome-associated protein
MADDLEIAPGVTIPLELVEIRVSRSSGPGGQHANVTESRVEAVLELDRVTSLSESQQARLIQKLGHRVTGSAQDTRSQARNRDLALERLTAKLAAALVRQAPRRKSRPTCASVERRLDSKRRQSSRKNQRRPPEDT